jgi:DNA-binding transcriptional LysR family regulator
LHLSQPPLSVQIRKLEAELGVRLFDRTRRSVALTDAGAALLGRARHLLAEAERARAEVKRIALGDGGPLAIGYTPTATYDVLPRLLPRFKARHPGVRLELVEMRSALLPEALHSGRVEVGFACAPVDAKGLRERALVRERPYVALPGAHRLAKRRRVGLRDLHREAFVTVRPDIEPGWANAAGELLRRAGLEPQVVQETDSKLALLGLIAAGLGVSIVSESMTKLRRVGVTLLPLSGVSLVFTLSLLTVEQPSPRAAAFLQAAVDAFPEQARPRGRRLA